MDDPAVVSAKARARDYVRARGSDAPVDAIRTGVRDACAAFEALVAGLSGDRAARRPAAEEWSVQEIADHLVETYRPGLDELRCLLAGERPPGSPIPASLQSKAPRLRPWPWLLRQLGEAHRDIAAMLDSAPDHGGLEVRAPVVMVVNVKGADGGILPIEWIEELDWKAYAIVSFRLHVVDHLKQARAALAT